MHVHRKRGNGPAADLRFAFVLPSYNDAHVLDRALHSVACAAAQSPADIAVIVVDNASTDATPDVAQQHGAHLVSEARRGVTWATCAGLDAAAELGARYAVRLDADVVVPNTYLRVLDGAWRGASESVVAITGPGRFELPGRSADVLSTLYLTAYRWSVGSALGHWPLFGSNFSVRTDWWRAVRDTVDPSDVRCHDDMAISFAVRPGETVRYVRELEVSLDPRALRGGAQLATRFARGAHTMRAGFRSSPPHRRLAERWKVS